MCVGLSWFWCCGGVGMMTAWLKVDEMTRNAGLSGVSAGELFTVGSWGVRVVFTGDRYGMQDCLTHKGAEPMVEFYDVRHAGEAFGPRGQFVSRYYLSTMLAHQEGAGLCLHGGVAAWSVTGAEFAVVAAFLRGVAVTWARQGLPTLLEVRS